MDNSQVIIGEFAARDEHFKSCTKNNGSLSDARNFGVTKASGQYILFIDSDNYINHDLLKRIDAAKDGCDIVRFFHQELSEDGRIIRTTPTAQGEVSLADRFQFELVDAACLYVYRREFWISSKFQYAVGRLHEDFGLIPLVPAKAEGMVAIDYIGYNYLRRDEGIATDAARRRKHVDYAMWFVTNMESAGEILNNEQFKYYANLMTNGLIPLAGRAHDDRDIALLVKELKHKQSHEFLEVNSPKRLVKYIAIRFSLQYTSSYLRQNSRVADCLS